LRHYRSKQKTAFLNTFCLAESIMTIGRALK